MKKGKEKEKGKDTDEDMDKDEGDAAVKQRCSSSPPRVSPCPPRACESNQGAPAAAANKSTTNKVTRLTPIGLAASSGQCQNIAVLVAAGGDVTNCGNSVRICVTLTLLAFTDWHV